MRKIVKALVIIVVVGAIVYFINYMTGNPITKANTQRQYLSYYENTYHEQFTVYSYEHNLKLSAPYYYFTIGPINDPNIKFGTGLYSQGISDEYGGILASAILTEDVASLLSPQYDYLNFSVAAEETPLTGIAGTHPDYFEPDPSVRLSKNLFAVHIIWTDTSMTDPQRQAIAAAMFKTIASQLPFKPAWLQVDVVVNNNNYGNFQFPLP